MTKDLWIVDAFTSVPFLGNAAAVCVLDDFPADSAMQKTAFQMQLSETAFAVRQSPLQYKLRWFTPEVEVNLCGHATLATAHVLQQSGQAKPGDTITFDTLSGKLKARILEKQIELDFPLLPGKPVKAPAVLKALGVEIVNCEQNDTNYLVEVKDYKTLVECKPDFKKLAKGTDYGIIITTNSGVPKEFDFASRYFAPAQGINEDPVCGSAHCMLAPYWEKRMNKSNFHAYQASKGRGVLDVTIKGDRTLIAGQAVTTLKGQLPARKGQAA